VHVKIISIRGYGDNPIYSRYLFYRVVFFLSQQTFFRVQLFKLSKKNVRWTAANTRVE